MSSELVCVIIVFLSTLSLRRATLWDAHRVKVYNKISIHALLAESDDDILAGVNELLISIHALLAESDNSQNDGPSFSVHDFYPRSPCGERPSENVRSSP